MLMNSGVMRGIVRQDEGCWRLVVRDGIWEYAVVVRAASPADAVTDTAEQTYCSSIGSVALPGWFATSDDAFEAALRYIDRWCVSVDERLETAS
jgi:hypothetical protein